MTNGRVLPAVALPAPGHPHAREDVPATRPTPTLVPAFGAGSAVRMARPIVVRQARKEAILTTPARAGMLIGVSAAIYAVSLAGISGLQAQTDADLAAQHQPMIETIAQARAANDALEATIVAADARTRDLAAQYAATGGDVAAYQAKLDELAALVAKVQGSAAALATKINLPTVTLHGAIGGVGRSGGSAPATGGTTSASGKP